MRIFLYVSVVFLFCSCKLFKKNSSSSEEVSKTEKTEAASEPEQPNSTIEIAEAQETNVMMAYHEVCDVFLAVLQTQNWEIINPFFAEPDLARYLSPKQTIDQTDQQIREKMIGPMTQRFKDNIGKLRKSAEENSVDLTKLRVQNCLYFDSDDPATVPRVLSVELGDGSKVYKIPVTVLDYKKQTYVFEILNTTRIFDK
ncbi:MAG: hypothetical protein JJ975_00230 [Bacteroidia bacterium]|nr:hypothetical protein [Bacteroidia bacterium]